VQKLIYWINTLPGRRCLLASTPKDLRDGEVVCELTSMLLGAKALQWPSGSSSGSGSGSGGVEATDATEAARLRVALEALSRDAGLRLSGDDDDSYVALPSPSPSKSPKKRLAAGKGKGGGGGGGRVGGGGDGGAADGATAVSTAAARVTHGDPATTLRVLAFLRQALGGEQLSAAGLSRRTLIAAGDPDSLRSSLRQSFSSRRGGAVQVKFS
jgi:hypothetical protein